MDICKSSIKLIGVLYKLKGSDHSVNHDIADIMSQMGAADDYEFWFCLRELNDKNYIDGYNYGSPIETRLTHKGLTYRQVINSKRISYVIGKLAAPIVVGVLATLITNWLTSSPTTTDLLPIQSENQQSYVQPYQQEMLERNNATSTSYQEFEEIDGANTED